MPPAPPATRPLRRVSVLVPTWQGGALLARSLAALAEQELGLPWELVAVDSGSTDGTRELLAERAAAFPVPLRVETIDQVAFDHGDTRNLLATRATGDLLVYLTQDAIPVGRGWLARLVANFDDPAVGAAYCRNVPRPDADPATRVLCREDPGYAPGRRETRLPDRDAYERLSPYERRLLYNFNDVASAVRRELWELHPFPRTWFGEDLLLARALLEAGWTVVYDDEAVVEHSHDHDERETYERARIDGRFGAEWIGYVGVETSADARALERRLEGGDAEAVRALGLPADEERAVLRRVRGLRRAALRGLLDGGRSPERRPPTALLPRSELRVLLVAHGFPPDTWAGTEVYTLNLARELARRGHEVAVLARAPAAGDEPEFAVREDRFEGLRVLRVTNRLRHRGLRDSYEDERAEEAFRRVLRAERPDVVHLQHLIHLSAGLVDVAREHGVPTVLHCHDYWAICPRVQLVRPDGGRCDHGRGAGCYACVKDRPELVPTLERVGAAGPELLAELLDELGHADFRDLAAREDRVLGAYAAADLLVSPSRFLRAKLLETGRFDPHRFLYSDNGMRVDGPRAAPKPREPGAPVVLGFVGSLVWYKGAETLVRAMARLGGLPVELRVHGDFRPDEDAHHAELARLVRDLGAENVAFRGRFDNARVAEVYAELDALVVPSVWFENSPITIHEAHLHATPVVASGIGGMAEYVRDGVDGLHFAPGDDVDLARTLRRLVEEPDLLPRLTADLPRLKTIEEDAAETEARYRALACRRRARVPATLLDVPGSAADVREGPVDEQGADMLLLRPGGAAVEYAVAAPDGVPVEVRVDVQALGGEEAVELGGRALLDGRPLGPLAPFRAGGSDEVRSYRLAGRLGGDAGRLRLESRLDGGAEAHLRVRRVVVREAPEEAGAEEQGAAWGS